MSSAERLTVWIEQLSEAAGNATSYIGGLNFADFEDDKRT